MKICLVDGCGKKSRALGRCQHHYDLFHKPSKGRKGRVCSVEGCGGPGGDRGLCKKHYMQQYLKAYYTKNKTKLRKNIAEYRQKNLEKDRADKRAWYAKNRDKMRRLAKEDNLKNPNKNRDRVKRWKENFPERAKQTAINAHVRRKGAEGTHTAEEVQRLFKLQKGLCIVCRRELKANYHQDHIVPLAAGGTNWISNIQLLCPPCNNTKGAKDPIAFMQERGHLL